MKTVEPILNLAMQHVWEREAPGVSVQKVETMRMVDSLNLCYRGLTSVGFGQPRRFFIAMLRADDQPDDAIQSAVARVVAEGHNRGGEYLSNGVVTDEFVEGAILPRPIDCVKP